MSIQGLSALHDRARRSRPPPLGRAAVHGPRHRSAARHERLRPQHRNRSPIHRPACRRMLVRAHLQEKPLRTSSYVLSSKRTNSPGGDTYRAVRARSCSSLSSRSVTVAALRTVCRPLPRGRLGSLWIGHTFVDQIFERAFLIGQFSTDNFRQNRCWCGTGAATLTALVCAAAARGAALESAPSGGASPRCLACGRGAEHGSNDTCNNSSGGEMADSGKDDEPMLAEGLAKPPDAVVSGSVVGAVQGLIWSDISGIDVMSVSVQHAHVAVPVESDTWRGVDVVELKVSPATLTMRLGSRTWRPQVVCEPWKLWPITSPCR